MGDLAYGSLRTLIHRGPQFIGGRVAVRMIAYVATHPRAKRVFAQVGLEHADHRGALGVGNAVERTACLKHIVDRSDDRMSPTPRILLHGKLLFTERLQPNRPFWVEVIGDLVFHPRGEALVEAEIVP